MFSIYPSRNSRFINTSNRFGWFCKKLMNGILTALFLGVVRDVGILQQFVASSELQTIISPVNVDCPWFGATHVAVIEIQLLGARPVPLDGLKDHVP